MFSLISANFSVIVVVVVVVIIINNLPKLTHVSFLNTLMTLLIGKVYYTWGLFVLT